MTQNVLGFSVASTNEMLTANSGAILFGEYLKAIRFDYLCNTFLPLPKSNRGLMPFEHIQPLLLMLHSGGRVLDDLRYIREDKALQETLKIKRVPLSQSVANWIWRHGLSGVYGMEQINRSVLKRHLKHITSPLILDIDASLIHSKKSSAEVTYKQFPGYAPMIGHINGGFVLHSEFRPGNIAPADHNLTFLKRCEEQLSKGKTISFFRADSATYQAEVFNHCNQNGITYTVGAKLDSSVLENIEQIKQWEPMKITEGTAHHLKEEVGEFLHTMQHTDHAFRIIVVKKRVAPMLPELWRLLSNEEKLVLCREYYSVIATNADESISAAQIVAFYRKRGDRSENRIKELKNGFNLSYLPSSDFISNAFYFQIGVIAYNLFILFKKMLQRSWQKHTVGTIRYKLYHTAGKVIRHSRRIILKIAQESTELFLRIRRRIYRASLE
ncbi:MAG: IS1380 family transposase [Sulfurovum sp.]|nr:IS1380 family transposase [Sulfurovum sp.]